MKQMIQVFEDGALVATINFRQLTCNRFEISTSTGVDLDVIATGRLLQLAAEQLHMDRVRFLSNEALKALVQRRLWDEDDEEPLPF